MTLITSVLRFQYAILAAFAGRLSPWFLPLLARFAFAAVLMSYFWASAMTKIDFESYSISAGAYAQIFPNTFEAAGYDVGLMTIGHALIVMVGTLAEFVLPAMILLGLMTRLAALGMIGFIFIQSITDIVGHGADKETIGAWFDRASDALILDQRLLWVAILMVIFVLLMVIFVLGAGRLSLDNLFGAEDKGA